MQEVPAGNVLAIAGLDMAILKSATVASSPLCRPLAPMLFQSAPIVRVAGGWLRAGTARRCVHSAHSARTVPQVQRAALLRGSPGHGSNYHIPLTSTPPNAAAAVEPAHPSDMPALAEGLRLLHRADPLVQVEVQDTGEHVVAAAGEPSVPVALRLCLWALGRGL